MGQEHEYAVVTNMTSYEQGWIWCKTLDEAMAEYLEYSRGMRESGDVILVKRLKVEVRVVVLNGDAGGGE